MDRELISSARSWPGSSGLTSHIPTPRTEELLWGPLLLAWAGARTGTQSLTIWGKHCADRAITLNFWCVVWLYMCFFQVSVWKLLPSYSHPPSLTLILTLLALPGKSLCVKGRMWYRNLILVLTTLKSVIPSVLISCGIPANCHFWNKFLWWGIRDVRIYGLNLRNR